MRATGANVCGALVWTGPAVKARCRKERVIEPAYTNSAQMGSEAGYEAKSGLRVVVEPVNRLDEVVSAVLLAGASSISFVEFEAGEAEEARREAARIAVSRARTTAESVSGHDESASAGFVGIRGSLTGSERALARMITKGTSRQSH